MNRLFFGAAFIAGLATLGWIGAGYLGAPLALAITLLIAAFYLWGAWDLLRFARATTSLANALAALQTTPDRLDDWLAPLPAPLRTAVRQRIEGGRTGLPGPVLAPYLSGLLVLLGMLGTFAGMVVALNGTGAALAGADGLAAIRDALSAPVRGLGLAFGTSIAGVAASAMLGLMTTLCRRDRIQAAQQLDVAMAATLRPFSRQYQREAQWRLVEQQASLMPAVVERIQDCMDALERQQQRFYGETATAYQGLAASVEKTLIASATGSAERAGAALQPAMTATLAGLAEQGARLQDALAQQVREQLSGLAAQFGNATSAVTTQWTSALAEHQRVSDGTATALQAALAQFTQGFEQRTAALADGLTERLAEQSEALSTRWGEALAQQARVGEQLADRQQQALQAATHSLAQQAAQFGDAATSVSTQWGHALAEHQRVSDSTATALQAALAQFTQGFEQRTSALADGLTARLAEQSEALSTLWHEALAQQAQTGERLATQQHQALQAATDGLAQHAAALHASVGAAHTQQQQQWAAQEEQRLAVWTQALQTHAGQLHEQWQAAGAQSAAQQRQAGEALALAASGIATHMQAQAEGVVAEVRQLVQAASEAPRAAAEMLGELRQKLADGMERDNALLEERGRILQALSTLADGAGEAAHRQHSAIDALVQQSADLMECATGRFADALAAQTARIDGAAAQVASSAVEVASLGEAFGGAVQLFGESNANMLAQLQRIEEALSKSLARSDEQLDYYVAQAREVIELSIAAQKHTIDEMQRLTERSEAAA
ncbi:MAG: DUF802 domain-containing protein [Acidovorax sp.]